MLTGVQVLRMAVQRSCPCLGASCQFSKNSCHQCAAESICVRKAFPKPSRPLHKWCLREQGEVGDIQLPWKFPTKLFLCLVKSSVCEDLFAHDKQTPAFVSN